MYTPEEFAQSIKKRGYTNNIAIARRYVKRTGKTEFDESDFEDAWRTLNARPIGREFIREMHDEVYVYYKRDADPKYSDYWLEEVREI